MRQLEIFLTAARHGNFTDTSRALGITAATIGQTISDLERTLGENVMLFERSKSGAQITDAGRLLVEHGERILSEEAAVRRDIAGLSLEQHGEGAVVRVAYEPVFAAAVRNAALHLLQRQGAFSTSRSFRVETSEADYTGISRKVLNSDADIGLSTTFPRSGDGGLTGYRVAESPLVLVASTRSKLASKKKVALNDLTKQYFALPLPTAIRTGNGPSLRDVIDEYFQEQSFQPERVIFEGNTIAAVLDMVRTAVPVTVAYEIAVPKESEWATSLTHTGPDLLSIPLAPPPNRDTALVAILKKGERPSLGAFTFHEMLVQSNKLKALSALPAAREPKRLQE
jgi:DNA-binding transcriptional LysR family regulator